MGERKARIHFGNLQRQPSTTWFERSDEQPGLVRTGCISPANGGTLETVLSVRIYPRAQLRRNFPRAQPGAVRIDCRSTIRRFELCGIQVRMAEPESARPEHDQSLLGTDGFHFLEDR